MNLSNLKEVVVDGIKLVELYINGVLAWKSGYKNWVKFSTESDGVTIYNGGLGYKSGYRVRSGGAEAAMGSASCTGYIPVKGGDVVRLSGYDAAYANTENAINVYDSSKTNLGQAARNGSYGVFNTTCSAYTWASVKEDPTGVWIWTVPPNANIAFIRVTGYTTDGSKMIVTRNEEIS